MLSAPTVQYNTNRNTDTFDIAEENRKNSKYDFKKNRKLHELDEGPVQGEHIYDQPGTHHTNKPSGVYVIQVILFCDMTSQPTRL